MDMLDELVEFYELVKDKDPQPTKQTHHVARNADNDDEWKRHEAKNWLTENKRNRDDDEKLYSQIRSILNKLSDDNFPVLVDEIKKLNIIDEQHLDKLSEFIFNKALIEPKFCASYAKLTYEFARYKPYNSDGMCFTRLIIARCQILFNDLLKITKDKSKCGMIFIGELYNCDKLLPPKIVSYCLNELINMQVKKQENDAQSTDTTIVECIFVFVKVIIEKFLKEHSNVMKDIYEKLNKLITSGKMSNREKFSLMDSADLIKKLGKL
jgi:hypothetical protein